MIKDVLVETLLLFQKKIDTVRSEYGEIVNDSEISNGIDEIYYVWNESGNETVPDKKCVNYHSSFLTGDDISLSVSRNFSNNSKENLLNHKRKHNVSLKLWHELNTKKLQYFMVDNKQELWYDSKPSAGGKKKVQFSIFELIDSIYFFFSNIFCGVSIQNIEDILV